MNQWKYINYDDIKSVPVKCSKISRVFVAFFGCWLCNPHIWSLFFYIEFHKLHLQILYPVWFIIFLHYDSWLRFSVYVLWFKVYKYMTLEFLAHDEIYTIDFVTNNKMSLIWTSTFIQKRELHLKLLLGILFYGHKTFSSYLIIIIFNCICIEFEAMGYHH